MTDYIVDESRFLITEEDETSFFTENYKLPSGIIISQKEDETDKWQLYISEDGKYYILAVKEDLYSKWVASNLLQATDFEQVTIKGHKLYLLYSPSTMKIARLTSIRCNHSMHFAFSMLSAFTHTRQLDFESNLRDGIYIESHSVILPTYSLVGAVSDRALFENTLRGPNDPESLKAPDGLNDSVSFNYFRNYLKKKGEKLAVNEPIFEAGEPVDDFMFGKTNKALITTPLILNDHFELFDTTTDRYFVVMEKLWAEALIASNLINQIALNSVVIGSRKYYTFSLAKTSAVECMNDRHAGLTKETAMELAQAIRRTRAKLPKAKLTDALYIQSLGILLPFNFTNSDDTNDRNLMLDCVVSGPFAMGPFIDDINKDLLLIASSN